MSDMFRLEAKDLINLRKFYRRAPKQFARAAAGVLNDFAFGTRREIINTIGRRMTVRNAKFVSSSTRVVKTPANAKFSRQETITGSIRRARFTGWEEQQTGKNPDKTRVASVAARSGSLKKQIKPAFRMKKGRDFPEPKDFPKKDPKIMIGRLRRKKFKKPFILRGKSPGLYRFLRKKIVPLQMFNTRDKPKRMDWMGQSVDRYFDRNPVRKTWAREIRKVLKLR